MIIIIIIRLYSVLSQWSKNASHHRRQSIIKNYKIPNYVYKNKTLHTKRANNNENSMLHVSP